MDRMLAGVSTRRFASVGEPAGEEVEQASSATGKSTVSELFIERRPAYLAGVPFAVVLDACVLYPLPLRDTLFRAAQHDLFAARWSQRILDEVVRNLIEDRRASPEQAGNLADAIRRAFEDAEIP